MSKLQTVKVTTTKDAYGFDEYNVVDLHGFMCRGCIGNKQQAYKIAESIDAAHIYEQKNGVGSLDLA